MWLKLSTSTHTRVCENPDARENRRPPNKKFAFINVLPFYYPRLGQWVRFGVLCAKLLCHLARSKFFTSLCTHFGSARQLHGNQEARAA